MMKTFASPRATARGSGTCVAVAVVVAFALGACGGGGGSSCGDETFEEQLGVESAGILQRQIAAENFVRDCMKANGFDYVPVDPAAQQADLVGQTGLSDEEFEQQFGYGLTTLYEQRKQLVDGPNEAIRNS